MNRSKLTLAAAVAALALIGASAPAHAQFWNLEGSWQGPAQINNSGQIKNAVQLSLTTETPNQNGTVTFGGTMQLCWSYDNGCTISYTTQ